ncbi:Histidine kinase-, DNA gyrase B-, and HSP90-like ATPase [Micromonospora matsumotoense]|uniref:Histidine kinase-, DNA gyrase B-, and HSP90-like ATPase n=1 Tax=Micromonospora matsumotoense TaxID=121616 RepID=A0A1C4Y512_9ACTN|nr:ATP-binding protein [Micromonospora matsumotoense]SCF15827.1 Histidine kinase-, DNA gyrase B-, and HSP90-like ATPase [Micromonospora matsumotoense]
MAIETIDVTPDPKILTILGDIEFSPWQCLAELIDNCCDNFLSTGVTNGERPTVQISLPSKGADLRSAEVGVADNGRGMDLATLNNAIRAGWSSNDAHGALGLFGMGFNIATARLGQRTQVRTTRAGDPHWIVVTIDLPSLHAGGTFDVPVTYEPKEDPEDHGTRVIISALRPERLNLLQGHQAIRIKLGDVYSYLLREHGIEIIVNLRKVVPRRPCIWGDDRYVMRNGAEIRAVQYIDENLGVMKACAVCGRWQTVDHDSCVFCPDGGRLEVREQRIHGWLGVQRYLHTSDFGIDFLRNGRKILLRDHRIFDWVDETGNEDPEREYPIDNPRNEGRIVGEIHCDHVAVNYQKTAFEYDTREWRKVVRTIRGEAPLRPNIAKKRGFLEENRSPLARLFTGFRTDKPGLKYLIPGNGETALRGEQIMDWVDRFRKGDEAYQSDDIWYRAAEQHDKGVVTPVTPGATDDVLDEMGLTQSAPTEPAPADPWSTNDRPGPGRAPSGTPATPTPARPETVDERLSRYRGAAVLAPAYGGRFDAADLGKIDVSVYAVDAADLLDPAGRTVPIFAHLARAPRVEVFLARRHPILTDFGIDLTEMVQVVLAEFLIARAPGTKQPLVTALEKLKGRASNDRRITVDSLAKRSRELLDQIRNQMLREIKGSPTSHWETLLPHEKGEAERRFALERLGDEWVDAIESGNFIHYLPATAVVRLIERRPDAFLDGRVFRRRYSTLTDQTARTLGLSRVTNLVSEIALMADHTPRLEADELRRMRLSCDLVERELDEA